MSKWIHWFSAAILIGAIIVIGSSTFGQFPAGKVEREETIATRLKELEDREEIRQLLTDYGQNLDRRDFSAFSQLFSEREGEWIGSFGKARGRDAIRRLMEKEIGFGAGRKVRVTYAHIFANEILRINGDRASATTKWILPVRRQREPSTTLCAGPLRCFPKP
jgi:hypothetical protein